MARSFDFFIADITVGCVALIAINFVLFSTFKHDMLASSLWAHYCKLHIYPFQVLTASKLIDYLFINLLRKKRSFVIVVVWMLFVVLLSFGRIATSPAHELEALGALEVSTTTRNLYDGNVALGVWAALSAVLYE